MKIENIYQKSKASEQFYFLARKQIRTELNKKEKAKLKELNEAIERFELTFMNLD